MIERRMILLGLGAAALATTAGCLSPQPGALTISATGSSGMNPGPGGADRPVTLTLVQLRATGAFDAADFFALQDPAGALGGDLVKADQITLAPGGSASKVIELDLSTTAIGVIAGFRDPAGRTFRARVSISPTSNAAYSITVGPSGVILARA